MQVLLRTRDPRQSMCVPHGRFPEALALELVPSAIVVVLPQYGRSIVLYMDTEHYEMMLSCEWVLKSIRDGSYSDLSHIIWARYWRLSEMKDFAQALGMAKLIEISMIALQGVEPEESDEEEQCLKVCPAWTEKSPKCY